VVETCQSGRSDNLGEGPARSEKCLFSDREGDLKLVVACLTIVVSLAVNFNYPNSARWHHHHGTTISRPSYLAVSVMSRATVIRLTFACRRGFSSVTDRLKGGKLQKIGTIITIRGIEIRGK